MNATSMKLKFKGRSVVVSSLKEASEIYCKARDASGLGGSKWPDGQIFEGATLVARVSYNGRVWSASYAAAFDNNVLLYDNGTGLENARKHALMNVLAAVVALAADVSK